jgi:hypothetical protein
MSTTFKIGDHVHWNSEGGHVSGHITKIHTRDTEYKGYTHHCSAADPLRDQERQDRPLGPAQGVSIESDR